MTDNLSNSRHVSYEQVKTIIDFMGQHVEFATGSLRSLEARHTSKKLWNVLTKLLNNCRSGTKKTSDGWSKYWSDFKNKLKNKISVIKKRKKSGSSSKKIIKPLTRLEKRALIILGPHFERKISKVSADPFSEVSSQCPPEVKLEAYLENGNNDFSNPQSESSERHSDGDRNSVMSEQSNHEFGGESDEDSNEPIIQSIYPKWLIEVEKKRAEADLMRAKAEEIRASAAKKASEAALVQAEALKRLADAATIQADAVLKIAVMFENRTCRDVLNI